MNCTTSTILDNRREIAENSRNEHATNVIFKGNIYVKQIALTFLLCLAASLATAADNRPNIIFIFTDDHAYQAISAYGSNRNVTPNLDRLAAEGMRFTRCCVTNSICGPSRATILTGKYCHLNGITRNEQTFNTAQQTFPKRLQQAGYQTGVVGKWHLANEADANSAGFDYTEILINQGPYYNPPMWRNGERVQHTGYTTHIITDLSLEWMKNRDKSKPFMMMVHHKAPHSNWDSYPTYYENYRNTVFPYPETFDDIYDGNRRAALEQDTTLIDVLAFRIPSLKIGPPPANLNEEQRAGWLKMYSGRRAEYDAVKDDPAALKSWTYQNLMRDYMSCVAAVDASVGKIMQFLKDEGIADNTVVIYNSDQGVFIGEHGWFDKRFMYEESLKTPLLVRWSGRIEPGSVNEDIVSNLDFAATFLDIAGVAVPDDMQGRSLVPIFEGNTPADWRKSFYYHYYEYPGHRMVKKNYGVYDGRFKLIHYYDDIDRWELIDLKEDPLELVNFYGHEKYTGEIKRLRAELGRLKEKYQVPSVVINTRSYIFDDEFAGQATPPVRHFFRGLREIIEQRKEVLGDQVR